MLRCPDDSKKPLESISLSLIQPITPMPRSQNIYEFVVLTIRYISKCVFSQSLAQVSVLHLRGGDALGRALEDGVLGRRGGLGGVEALVLVVHAGVLDLGRLAVAHAPPLLELVQEGEVGGLDDAGGGHGHEDAQHGPQAGQVLGRVLGVEDQRADDVARRRRRVVHRHDDGLLGGARRVGDDPRDGDGDATCNIRS